MRQGIDYLSAIAHSLLRQGFKRQIYISFHGPAHMTCSPMVRDFFDETGVPILYMDLSQQLGKLAKDLFTSMDCFHAITVGAYQIMGRLEDIPLTTAYAEPMQQSCAPFNDLFGLAYQSAAIGYCFAKQSDHMPTTAIPDAAARQRLADEGQSILEKAVAAMDMPHVVEQMRKLESRLLPENICYEQVRGLRLEAIEKLQRVRPYNIGQASRISGVSPADISVLLIYLSSR